MPGAIGSKTFHFPMTNLLVFKVPNETKISHRWRGRANK